MPKLGQLTAAWGTGLWMVLNMYKGFPHGMPTTQADTINADLLAFIKA
jgi:hypothetical protein